MEPITIEPITKPDTKPVITPRPDHNDPFNVPIPKIDPSPLGFIRLYNLSKK